MSDDTGSDGAMAGGKRSAWMTHVKATMKAHKGMKLMQVLKMAKKTYKKTRRGGGSTITPNTYEGAVVGGRRRRNGKSTRRTRKH